ncbi:MAG: hypothetical protein H6719_33515 [Sandaracinaceae bacterium]|nr:hypothetical protein [Sandaracinaceae bacterium]
MSRELPNRAPPMGRRLWIAAVLAPALAVLPGDASSQTADPAETLGGTWRLAGSRAEAEATVDAAVDRAVDAMSYFVRAIARPRLREGTSIDDRIELLFEPEGRLRVRFSGRDGRSEYVTTLGRTESRVRADGSRIRVTQRLHEDGSLEQVFQTDGGTRWYVYRPTSSGALTLDVTTDSDRMPEAMRFRLSYRR